MPTLRRQPGQGARRRVRACRPGRHRRAAPLLRPHAGRLPPGTLDVQTAFPSSRGRIRL